MATTYAKLRDGQWGLRGSNLVAGESVTVQKRDGSSKIETVGKVLWTGKDGVCLATIRTRDSQPTSERHSGNGNVRSTYRKKYGWDGVVGSSSYYTSGLYDEES